MAEYYLISQLPSLDGVGDNTPLPITEERFTELCERFLGKRALREIKNLTISPSMNFERTASALINAWCDGERNLRLALCKIRAEKMNKSFDMPNVNIPQEAFKAAITASEIKNPLDAEKFLLQYRLSFLEMLRPMDNFSEEYVFYYALKLKLLSRIYCFDATLGESVYKKIYSSILDGEGLEAKDEQ